MLPFGELLQAVGGLGGGVGGCGRLFGGAVEPDLPLHHVGEDEQQRHAAEHCPAQGVEQVVGEAALKIGGEQQGVEQGEEDGEAAVEALPEQAAGFFHAFAFVVAQKGMTRRRPLPTMNQQERLTARETAAVIRMMARFA